MHIANAENNFVSRAEGKLEGAVRAFSYDFRNKTVLDIGSSTGGFTELALKLGAKKVIAIEKGTRQMKAPLRFDPRVELYEKTDFFDVAHNNSDLTRFGGSRPRSLTPAVAGFALFESPAGDSPRPKGRTGQGLEPHESSLSNTVILRGHIDTVLADVSFVSLAKILRHARQFADSKTDFLVMLKPQFEARPDQLFKGVVKNEKIRREIIRNFEIWLKNNKFLVVNKRDNDVIGKNGNQERFYYLKIAK